MGKTSHSRRQFKLDKILARQGGRTDRAGLRNETRQTAYENGMDPNEAWAGAAADITKSISNAVTSGFSASSTKAGYESVVNSGGKTYGTVNEGGNSMFLFGALGLLLVLMMKK